MQLRFWSSFVIFVGSYFPLALILLVQDINFVVGLGNICAKFWAPGCGCFAMLEHPMQSFIPVVVTGFSLTVVMLILSKVNHKRSVTLKSAKYVPAELMSYTIPYVVAFMGVGYDDVGQTLAVCLVLCWIFWITHMSGQIILNPVLVAFGWRLYDVEFEFVGDTKRYNTRAISKSILGSDEACKHAFVQDILVLSKEP